MGEKEVSKELPAEHQSVVPSGGSHESGIDLEYEKKLMFVSLGQSQLQKFLRILTFK